MLLYNKKNISVRGNGTSIPIMEMSNEAMQRNYQSKILKFSFICKLPKYCEKIILHFYTKINHLKTMNSCFRRN